MNVWYGLISSNLLRIPFECFKISLEILIRSTIILILKKTLISLLILFHQHISLHHLTFQHLNLSHLHILL